MIWLILGLATAAVTLALLWPLLRPPAEGAERARHDIEVYRDQLAEIETERSRGGIAASEADAARREIERRLLRAGDELGKGRRSSGQGLAAAIAIGLLVPAGATALYLKLGQPTLPAQPLATREMGQAQMAQAREAGDIAEMAAKLSQRLEANPEDGQGWFLLGRAYLQMERFDDAVRAYGRAVNLAPADVNSRMALAEARVYAARGMVTPEAVAEFERLLQMDPQHPGARYYVALSRSQAGDVKGAFEGWKALAADSAPDAPWQQVLQARLREAAQTLKIDLAEALPKSAPTAPPQGQAPRGPSAEQMQAAAGMSAEDRQTMIRGMVDSLAARLADSPNDPEGWDRLARAYDVLGESDKAKDARARGETVRRLTAPPPTTAAAPPPAPAPAPVPSATPRGPTPEQMQAAGKMTAEDRQAMIRGMVEGLAEKLKDNPNDIEGWMRLARSWEVLQEPEKAQAAWEKVKTLEAGGKLAAAPAPAQTGPALSATDRAEMQRLVGQLETRLKTQPNDPEGWTRLGQARTMLGQPKEARIAFGEASKLKPNDVDLLLDHAGAILDDEGSTGPIPAPADAIYRQVLALAPDNPDALWYVGVSELQAGRARVAVVYWEKLLAKLDPKSVEASQVREAVEAAKKK